MNQLYVIVHEGRIMIDLVNFGGLDHLDLDESSKYFFVIQEIKRIKEQEEFRNVEGDEREVNYPIPADTKIKVCGAYGEACVDIHVQALQQKGFEAEMHKEGTIFLEDIHELPALRSDRVAIERLHYLTKSHVGKNR